jgi:SnoaL-like protein
MKKRMLWLGLIAVVALAIAIPIANAAGGRHPSRGHGHHGNHGRSLERLVAAHIAALHACDADALTAGYTNDAKLFFPDGAVVTGRAAIQQLYDGFVKSVADGGLCGLHAQAVDSFQRGRSIFVKFEVTAPFLAQSYFSTDGYIFKGNRIASEVSTFDASKLKFK